MTEETGRIGTEPDGAADAGAPRRRTRTIVFVIIGALLVTAVIAVGVFLGTTLAGGDENHDDESRPAVPVPSVSTEANAEPEDQADIEATATPPAEATAPSAGGAYAIAAVESTGDRDADAKFDLLMSGHADSLEADTPNPFADTNEARGFALEVCRMFEAEDRPGFEALLNSVDESYLYGSTYPAFLGVDVYCDSQQGKVVEWWVSHTISGS